MADEPLSRPVNGEILAAPAREVGPARRSEAIDAVFESLRQDPQGRATAAPTPPTGGLTVLSSSGAAPAGERGGPLFWATGLLLIVTAFWISGGHALFSGLRWPSLFLAEPAFTMLDSSTQTQAIGGRLYLLVDGTLQNTGMEAAAAPDIRIVVVDGDGVTTRYHLGLGKRIIEPGDTADFSSRLDAPLSGVKKVTVDYSGE